MPSPEHKQLIQTLNRWIQQERWQKIPKAQGTVLKKSLTKSGNIKVVIKGKNKEITFYVLQRNKNLFATASHLEKGDVLSIATRTHLGRRYAVKLAKKSG